MIDRLIDLEIYRNRYIFYFILHIFTIIYHYKYTLNFWRKSGSKWESKRKKGDHELTLVNVNMQIVPKFKSLLGYHQWRLQVSPTI